MKIPGSAALANDLVSVENAAITPPEGNHSGIEEQFLSFDWVGEEFLQYSVDIN